MICMCGDATSTAAVSPGASRKSVIAVYKHSAEDVRRVDNQNIPFVRRVLIQNIKKLLFAGGARRAWFGSA